jgi:hypothetical protein
MKARLISFYEIKEKIREVVKELDRRPLLVVKMAGDLLFLLGICLSQMKAADAATYPEKDEHLSILQSASEALTYKINACTIEEATIQVNKAYKAFGVN